MDQLPGFLQFVCLRQRICWAIRPYFVGSVAGVHALYKEYISKDQDKLSEALILVFIVGSSRPSWPTRFTRNTRRKSMFSFL